MPINPSANGQRYDRVLDARRAIVSRYKAKRYTINEIVAALEADHGIKVSRITVIRDLAACVDEWRKVMAEGIDAHKLAQWASLDEVERNGWLNSDYKTVLEAIRQKRALMGTDAPTQSEQRLALTAGAGVEYIEVPAPPSAPSEPA